MFSGKNFSIAQLLCLPGVEFLPMDKVTSNEKYKALTKPNFKKILGKTVGIGADQLCADSLNYVQDEPMSLLDSLCAALNVHTIMLGVMSSNYRGFNAAAGFGNGYMNLI